MEHEHTFEQYELTLTPREVLFLNRPADAEYRPVWYTGWACLCGEQGYRVPA